MIFRRQGKQLPSVPLRVALVVPFVLQTVGLVALVGYLSYRSGQQATENLAQQLLQQTSARVSDRLQFYLHRPQEVVEANRLEVMQGTLNPNNPEQLRRHLWQQIMLDPTMPSNGFWGEASQSVIYVRISSEAFRQMAERITGHSIPAGTLLYGDIRGKRRRFFLTDSQGKPGKLIYQIEDDVRTVDWYQAAQTIGEQHWTPVNPARIVPFLQTLAINPIYDQSGAFQGFFASNYLLPEISEFLQQVKFSPSGQVFIVEASGDLVATSVPSEASGMRQVNGKLRRVSALESQDERTRVVARHLKQQLGPLDQLQGATQQTVSVADQRLFVQVSPYQDQYGLRWYVITVIPELDFMAQIQQNIRITALLCLLALAGAIAAGFTLSNRFSSRIRRLNQASEELAAGDLTQHLPADSTITELQGLAQSFNQMAEQLRQSFQCQVEAEAARQSDARFQQLATAAPGMIYTFTQHPDGSHQFEYVSSASREILELAPDQVMADPEVVLCQIHPDDRPQHEQAVACSAETLEPFIFTFRNQTPSGQLKYLEANSRPLRQDNGSISWYGVLIDVSDRKHMEVALQQSESQTRMILNGVTAAITSTRVFPDGTWSIDQVSAGCESLSGYTADELTQDQQLWLSRIEPEDWQPLFPQTIANIMAEQTATYEYRFHRKDDRLCWISQTNNSRWDEVQQCWVVTMLSVDITPRKTAELSLQGLNQSLEQMVAERTADLCASEAQIRQQINREMLLRQITQRIRQSLDLKTIFQTTCQEVLQWSQVERVAIFQFEPDSHWSRGEFIAEAVLPPFSSVLGMPIQDECFGRSYAHLYQHGHVYQIEDVDQANLQDCHQQILTQLKIRAKLIVPFLLGQELWGLLCLHQCSAPRQWDPYEVQVIQEISNQLAIAIQQASLVEQLQYQLIERKQAQQQLAERNQQLAISNQELAQATRLKDEFLATMSHELRTPLNAILGMTEGLQEQVFGAITDQQLMALQTIDRSGSHLLELINDILDLAKIEAGQVDLHCTAVPVLALCQSSLELLKQQALKKQLQCQLNCPSDLPTLWIDQRRVRQVLVNLLDNAVKFTPQGGQITLEVSVPIHPSDPDQTSWLQISVRDTGIGIAPEHLPKLFQSFSQVDSALNRQYEGTGLGLVLAKRIVELHGGQIGVTSEAGVGSYFTITLPCVAAPIADPAPLDQTSMVLDIQANQPTTPLILLVEDNEANIMTIANYLQAKGYQLLVARDGQEALNLLQDHHPDVILMDIQMPGMDGLAAIQHIRQLPDRSETPIIALTALAMEGDRDRCLAAGADDYLTKPVKLKQLIALIQQFLQPN